MSRNQCSELNGNSVRCFDALLHLERPDATQCHRHSGDVISEGKNIMQHYLPLQVAQTERACTCLQTFCILKYTHTQFHSGTEHINKNVAGVEKLTLEEEKANFEALTAELKMMHQCPCLCCVPLELYYSLWPHNKTN